MILFPAVDIKDGRCVRLKQGLADQVTVFSDDPTAMARHWVDLGSDWLHVIDLDGAFSGKPVNEALIRAICSGQGMEKTPSVQLGGGIRDLDTAKSYVDAGVTRLIIGTMALEDPAGFEKLCAALPGRIGVSLDAVDGKLKTRGWVEDSGLTATEALPRLVDAGASFIIYTDISRDGMHSGVNLEAMTALVEASAVPVLAAGGVSTLADIETLYPLHAKGLQGVITGRAIYEGTLDFSEALAWLRAKG